MADNLREQGVEEEMADPAQKDVIKGRIDGYIIIHESFTAEESVECLQGLQALINSIRKL